MHGVGWCQPSAALMPAQSLIPAQRSDEFIRPARRHQPVGRTIGGIGDLDFHYGIYPPAEAHVGEAIEAGSTFGGGLTF